MFKVAIYTVLFLSLNISLTLCNKALFKLYGFTFPIFIILYGTALTFVATLILSFTWMAPEGPPIWAKLHFHWKRLAVLSLIHVTTSILVAESLTLISISLVQVMKMLTPLISLAVHVAYKREIPPISHWICICVIVIGASMCLTKTPEIGIGISFYLGVFLAFASTVNGAIQPYLAQYIMQENESHPLAPIEISVLTSFCILVMVTPFMIVLELRGILSYNQWQISGFLLLCINGVMAVLYTIVTFYMIHHSHPTFVNVVGTIRILLLILFSTVFLQAPYSLLSIVGMVVAFIGFFVFVMLPKDVS